MIWLIMVSALADPGRRRDPMCGTDPEGNPTGPAEQSVLFNAEGIRNVCQIRSVDLGDDSGVI